MTMGALYLAMTRPRATGVRCNRLENATFRRDSALMRWGFLACAMLILFAPATAWAQSSITLDARAGAPIIEAQIDRRAARLEVDLRMPGGLALSRASAERLSVRTSPFRRVGIAVEGGSSMRGRFAQPRVVVGEAETRAWAGVFPSSVSTRADGVIGPGALPYDVVTVTFADEHAEARAIVLPMWESEYWVARSQVRGEELLLMFDVANAPTIFNRSAARRYDASGAIASAGELVAANYTLGLSTMMQPVTTELSVEGIALVTTLARTNAPLLGVDEEDAIVVGAANATASPAGVTIGRDALTRAGCSSIRVDHRAHQMTLRCAPA
jgi:hypothetical protein